MQDVCLFAHFDKDNKVDDYVLRYLVKIKELGFRIIFISTSRLSSDWVERLRDDCSEVILRKNNGLDFASWSKGFAKHCGAIGGRLLLANDSVYGPIGSLHSALDRLTSVPADFYGMVESVEVAPHLQSWFLLFEPWVVQNAEFTAILAQPFATMTKKEIITKGEIGLSRRLIGAGFRYRALYHSDRLGLISRLQAINPTHLFWRELLFEHGVPFLKVELLRDNPLGIENAATILQSVRRVEPALCDVIESHLARTRGVAAVRRSRWPFFNRLRNLLIRKRYRLARDNKRLEAVMNAIFLEGLSAPLIAWRAVSALFRSR